MEELAGPVFTLKDFGIGFAPISGQPVMILTTDEGDVPVAYVSPM